VLLGLTYLFVAATNFLTNLEAFVTIMIVTATPWMVIIGIEFLLSRNDIAPLDLHAFAIPGMRGKYWFSNGINPRAMVAWLCGAGVGLLFSTNSLFTGPLENSVNGVDISWLVAGVVGGLVYLTLRYALRGAVSLAGARDKDLAEPVPGMDAGA
jgi:purine-cytosine permease-like protein